jgi:hypothetical protein
LCEGEGGIFAIIRSNSWSLENILKYHKVKKNHLFFYPAQL